MAAKGMAAETEPVARQAGLVRVRVVTVQAIHAARMHAAAEEGGVFVILTTNLAISIVNLTRIHLEQMEMVRKSIARFEIIRQVTAEGVAGATGIHDLVAGGMGQGGVGFSGFPELLLPGIVGGQRAMTGFATNGRFGHGGMEGVIGFRVIGPQTGVVAGGAHGIPIHTATGPVAPFARLTVLITVRIEPLPGVGIVGGFEGLPAATWKRDEVL